MKKLLLILLCLPIMTLAQKTYVPDDVFENYLENNGLGDGFWLNDSVFTSAIDTITHLNPPSYLGITDLTGVFDFSELFWLNIDYQNLTELDLSGLTKLNCVYARYNNIISVNTVGADSLHRLYIDYNNVMELDISSNLNMTALNLSYNDLHCLTIGNNIGFTQTTHPSSSDWQFNVVGNTNLNCIQTDNVGWCQANLTLHVPTSVTFNSICDTTNCSGVLAIEEYTTNKELLRTVDVLGRETKGTKNEPLFYIYDDGTVEKRITIE